MKGVGWTLGLCVFYLLWFLSVMIPVYSRNRAYAIFFIAFTLIGESGRVCRGHLGQGSRCVPQPCDLPST